MRPLVMILLGIVVFALALESLGFVVAVVALILIGGFADPDLRPLESAGARAVPRGLFGRHFRRPARPAVEPVAEPLRDAAWTSCPISPSASASRSPCKNLLYCFIGVFLGTLIGVLPGIGPVATVAMLLPLTFNLDPATAMIMLAGIYYGAQYGGSTTAILVNIPGELLLGGHHDRRPPDGEAGPRRTRARHRGDRLVHRRLRSRRWWSRCSRRRSPRSR